MTNKGRKFIKIRMLIIVLMGIFGYTLLGAQHNSILHHVMYWALIAATVLFIVTVFISAPDID